MAYGNRCVKGFVRTDGRFMVNEDGERVVLTGWGMGNWMNPEGFMVCGIGGMYGFTEFSEKMINNIRFDRRRTIAASIRELCGSDYEKGFWPRWYRNYLGETDICALAEMGYNSIRLVLDGSALLFEEPGIQFNEETFAILGEVIDLCEKYRIYAILDLHAAPGGQSGVSCDNGLDNMPHTFLEEESYERTIVLWEELAKRYKDRWIVAGYELLNEPIAPPHLNSMALQLRKFYEETIERIRSIDTKHMIILQSPAFAHDMGFFREGFDPEYSNWCYSVHMYWSAPEMREFYPYLEPSLRLNVPVWYGEGRNTPEAMAILLDQLERHGVGYNLFCWKGMDNKNHTDNGMVTFPMPEGWEKIMDYIQKGGPRPSYEESQKILDEWIEAAKYENSIIDKQLYRYTHRMQGIELPAIGYDAGTNYGTWEYSNPFNYRMEDKMKMVIREGGEYPSCFPGYKGKNFLLDNLVLELRQGECVSYTVHQVTSKCVVCADICSSENTKLEIASGQEKQVIHISQNSQKGKRKLMTLSPAEHQTIQFKVLEGSVQLDKIYFCD